MHKSMDLIVLKDKVKQELLNLPHIFYCYLLTVLIRKFRLRNMAKF